MAAKVRLLTSDGALFAGVASLQHAAGHADSRKYVCVGDTIQTEAEEATLRGHGTHLVGTQLVATLCGVLEKVDQLVFVRPLKTRYEAAQGDVVVGRVTEVAGKRWKVDLASRQEAGLLLSAINLPGNIQRRRNAEDELRMRAVLREGDLLSAEVQSVHTDGSVALHTRSNKYGKLEGGQLIVVPAALVKRQKQHFHFLESQGVQLILGCNGLLWVAPGTGESAQQAEQAAQGAGDMDMSDGPKPRPIPTQQQLRAVVRIGCLMRALARCYLPIFPASIAAADELALELGTPLEELGGSDFLTALLNSEANRRREVS